MHLELIRALLFQIQDDLLDALVMLKRWANNRGDIIQGKKTYLYLKALELADENQKSTLLAYYQPDSGHDQYEKIETVKKYSGIQGLRNMHCRSEMRTTTWPNLM